MPSGHLTMPGTDGRQRHPTMPRTDGRQGHLTMPGGDLHKCPPEPHLGYTSAGDPLASPLPRRPALTLETTSPAPQPLGPPAGSGQEWL